MSDDGLRIGDSEREQAARAIGEHFAQGRLTNDEHEERLDRVWRAKTYGDLRPMFADLPGPRPAFLERPAPRPFPFAGPPRPSYPPAPYGSGLSVPPLIHHQGRWSPLVLVLAAIGAVWLLKGFGVFIAVVVLCILLSKRRGRRQGPPPEYHSGHGPWHR